MQICTLAFFPRAFIVGIVKSARVFFLQVVSLLW